MIAEKSYPILIIGGGIGGLATAIGLRKAGFQVAVFTQSMGKDVTFQLPDKAARSCDRI